MTTAEMMARRSRTRARLGKRVRGFGNSGFHRWIGGTSRSTPLSFLRKASMRSIVFWQHMAPPNILYVRPYGIRFRRTFAAYAHRSLVEAPYAGLGSALHRAFAVHDKQVR